MNLQPSISIANTAFDTSSMMFFLPNEWLKSTILGNDISIL